VTVLACHALALRSAPSFHIENFFSSKCYKDIWIFAEANMAASIWRSFETLLLSFAVGSLLPHFRGFYRFFPQLSRTLGKPAGQNGDF
jgi:hypothetical protein